MNCTHDRVYFDLTNNVQRCQNCLHEQAIDWGSENMWVDPDVEAPVSPETCYHSYKEYVGFTAKYMYCTKCDHKLNEYLGK
jgi:hypothetical protein